MEVPAVEEEGVDEEEDVDEEGADKDELVLTQRQHPNRCQCQSEKRKLFRYERAQDVAALCVLTLAQNAYFAAILTFAHTHITPDLNQNQI